MSASVSTRTVVHARQPSAQKLELSSEHGWRLTAGNQHGYRLEQTLSACATVCTRAATALLVAAGRGTAPGGPWTTAAPAAANKEQKHGQRRTRPPTLLADHNVEPDPRHPCSAARCDSERRFPGDEPAHRGRVRRRVPTPTGAPGGAGAAHGQMSQLAKGWRRRWATATRPWTTSNRACCEPRAAGETPAPPSRGSVASWRHRRRLRGLLAELERPWSRSQRAVQALGAAREELRGEKVGRRGPGRAAHRGGLPPGQLIHRRRYRPARRRPWPKFERLRALCFPIPSGSVLTPWRLPGWVAAGPAGRLEAAARGADAERLARALAEPVAGAWAAPPCTNSGRPSSTRS